MRRSDVRAVKRTTAFAIALAALLGWNSAARADACIRPDLVETWPTDGATGVPLNARLSSHYTASAEYLGEPVVLEQVGVGPQTGTATFEANEGLLSLAPDQPLVANASYTIAWPALRGLTTAALGKGGTVRFAAGLADDVETPRFTGVQSIAWDVERPTDDCTDSPDDRYWFDLGLGEADDDGGRDRLTLVVFQTAGPNLVVGSPQQVLITRLPESGKPARVHRSIDSAVGHVCFAALVRDSLGRISASADREVCTTTVRPPFFYGCAVCRRGLTGHEPGLRGARAVSWIVILFLALARRFCERPTFAGRRRAR
jgi:hypothetical protein